MHRSMCSSRTTGNTKQVPPTPRRYWTPPEEEALINGLKSLRASGWKCDGTFRGGYMVRLEKMMAEKCPNAGIGVKNIKSKLQVWKKDYGLVLGILGTSGGAGASLDPATNMIICESESVWDDYIKVHKEAGKLRGRPLPWFNDWVDIFGNDRAQGGGAIDIGDAVQELLYGGHAKSAGDTNDDHSRSNPTPISNSVDDPYDEAISKSPPLAPEPPAKSSSKTNKRKRCDSSDDAIENLLGQFMDDAKSTLGGIADELKSNPNPTQSSLDRDTCARVKCYDALSEIDDLTLDDRVLATHILVHSKEDLDAFWGMDGEARSRYVRLLLKGHLG